MKKNLEEEKIKLILTVIPILLIVLILLITLAVNKKKSSKDAQQDLQESVMHYADDQQENPAGPDLPGLANEKTEAEKPLSAAEMELPVTQEGSGTFLATPEAETEKTDYSRVKFDRDAQLKEMMTYWQDNNQEALDDLANLDRFRAMSWSLKKDTDFYYYGDKNSAGKPEGCGIAVYTDNRYYYGEWKNGERSGRGSWMHYHIRGERNTTDLYTYHQYVGSWAHDLPEGEGAEHYDLRRKNLKENTRYYSNFIGSYHKGLRNGEFYVTTTDSEEHMLEWNAVADQGVYVYQNASADKKGNRTVMVERLDPDNYIWMDPKDNKNQGVPCLISEIR